eukprot:COSAG02_NODE_3734_length_6311_cov_70.627173_6_plen_155_part_00
MMRARRVDHPRGHVVTATVAVLCLAASTRVVLACLVRHSTADAGSHGTAPRLRCSESVRIRLFRRIVAFRIARENLALDGRPERVIAGGGSSSRRAGSSRVADRRMEGRCCKNNNLHSHAHRFLLVRPRNSRLRVARARASSHAPHARIALESV